MRILIDIQSMQTGSKFRGIGNYSFALVKKILEINKKHEIILLYNGQYSDYPEQFSDLINNINIKQFYCLDDSREMVCDKGNLIASEKLREYYIECINPDFLLITSLFEGWGDKFVCSINHEHRYKVGVIGYDLIPLINPDLYLADPGVKSWYFRKIESLKNADYIFSISESAKEEFKEYLSINSEKLYNISSAADDIYSTPLEGSENIRTYFPLEKKFILYCGAADERKNLSGLLHAFSKLPDELRDKYQIVLVGKYPEDAKQTLNTLAHKLNITDGTLVFTDFITNKILKALYYECWLFVFPSFHEGFGLPVLEAMKCEAPTICSNTSSLPEVIGLKEAMFDPYNIDDIHDKLYKALEDDTFREILIDNAKKRSLYFSWDKTACKLLDFVDKNVEPITIGYDFSNDYNNQIITISEVINKYNIDNENIKKIAKCIADIQISTGSVIESKHTLFIDISSLIHVNLKTGIQRVVESICNVLNNSDFCGKDFNCKFIYSQNNTQLFYYVSIENGSFTTSRENGTDNQVEFIDGDKILFLDLHLSLFDRSFLEKMNSAGVETYYVLYDLLPVTHSKYFSSAQIEEFKRWLELIFYSNGVICISNDVMQKLMKWRFDKNLTISNNFKFDYFHLGSELELSNPTKGIHDKANKIKQNCSERISFIMVGTIEPRKGHQHIIDVFDLLWERGIDVSLIIVGKEGWNVESIVKSIKNNKELNRRLFWLDDVSDEYLDDLYSQCNCLIAASEGEGFGLPLIEAARNKLPIISRDLSIFREVAGDNAYYFSTNRKPRDTADTVINWIELYKEDKHPKSELMNWLTWEQSTKQLLGCIGVSSKE